MLSMRRLWHLACLGSLTLRDVSATANPAVKVKLSAAWPSPPLLLEILETISLEKPNAFFELLDVLTAPEHGLHYVASSSDEALHEAAFQIAKDNGFLSGAGSMDAARRTLALHVASPKVEAFHHYYDDSVHVWPGPPEGWNEVSCGSWVDWYGTRICDAETLRHVVETETIGEKKTDETDEMSPEEVLSSLRNRTVDVLPFDHIRPTPGSILNYPLRSAILYANMTSPNFRSLHSYLLSTSSQSESGALAQLQYIVRFVPPTSNRRANMPLAGYATTLDLKKTEYLAQDDRVRKGREQERTEQSNGDAADEYVDLSEALLSELPLFEDKDLTSPLEDEEMPLLGLQATQLVMSSSDPLKTLIDLSHNFPKHMLSLARRVNVSENLTEEAMTNQGIIGPGANVMWLNGQLLPETDVHPFGLLRLLRKERHIMSSLTSLGLNATEAMQALTHPALLEAQAGGAVLDNLFDASDRPEGGNITVWWNDLESDSRYLSWGSTIQLLLRPTWGGQSHPIARNLFNAVFVADLSTRDGMALSASFQRIIQQGFPLRFGVVPLVGSEEATKAARLFYFLVEHYGRSRTMDFIKELVAVDSPTIDFSVARRIFDELVANNLSDSEGSETDFDAVLTGSAEAIIVSEDGEEHPSRIKKLAHYAERLALTSTEGTGHVFMNGKHFPIDSRAFHNIQREMAAQTQFIQEKLMSGKLDDTDKPDVSNYFYDLPTTLIRRNTYIYPSAAHGLLRMYPLADLENEVGLVQKETEFIYPDEASETPISISVVGNMDSELCLTLLEQLIQGMAAENVTYRASYIHIPKADSQSNENYYASSTLHYLQHKGLLGTMPPVKALQQVETLRSLVQVEASDEEVRGIFGEERVLQIFKGKVRDIVTSASYRKAGEIGLLLSEKLGLSGDGAHIFVNGRIIGPVTPNSFSAQDFNALADYEMRKRVTPTVAALTNSSFAATLQRSPKANLVAGVSSIISAAHVPDPAEQGIYQRHQNPRNRLYEKFEGNFSHFTMGNNETSTFHIAALLDPLSETSRKWSSIIEWLSGIQGVYIEIYLSPKQDGEIPLKSFFRYNLPDQMKFDNAGAEETPITSFNDLPTEPIYTLAMDTPTAWLVRPKESIHDLDNIQLSRLSQGELATGVEASFRLDNLVIEGHSVHPIDNSPTAGLQLQLSGSHGVSVADTMVVANLGYFQLKAPHPGLFSLDIHGDRGKEIYHMVSAGNLGFNSPNVTEIGNRISLTSLEGLTLFPRFAKNPGMEQENVLMPLRKATEEAKGPLSNMYDKVTSLLWGQTNDTEQVEVASQDIAVKQADINVFTVASGHLYERLSSIMVLSVLRNTNHTVKFWFIENFLSPSFLEFIPHFAKEYGFEYELVTYKWPSWLLAQKEKQRIIWAYKILFLDVLFPMDLKKVIFVDADQIMRADLKELIDLDLQGAPYGYTPMGDDNVDMEGFRFWKTGYWSQFLQGLPYHISALYVVDLERFREIAAGDRLRASYQHLSLDPNSLSNLDQDLPNNMQHEIPIFSLHEDWLWCETWCSMERFERAKSIDLCFNPLTKESKLTRARKTPGWIDYDNEIARFARRLVDEGTILSDVVAADTESLAKAGKTAKEAEEEEAQEKSFEIVGPDATESVPPPTEGETAEEAPHQEMSHDEL